MCSNIIDFPGSKKPKRIRQERFTVEQIDSEKFIPMSQLDFTCPTCHTTTNFRFNNMIFKNLQFYCAKCGSGWRVSNKIFNGATNRENKAL